MWKLAKTCYENRGDDQHETYQPKWSNYKSANNNRRPTQLATTQMRTMNDVEQQMNKQTVGRILLHEDFHCKTILNPCKKQFNVT